MAFISINDDHIFYNLRKGKWREWNRSSKIMKLERKWAKSRIASRCWIRGSSSLHILSRVRSEFHFVRIFLTMPQFCLWSHFSKLTFGLLLVWQHCLKSMLKALQNTKWSSFFKVFTWGFKKKPWISIWSILQEQLLKSVRVFQNLWNSCSFL